jgi:hypothetical protein
MGGIATVLEGLPVKEKGDLPDRRARQTVGEACKTGEEVLTRSLSVGLKPTRQGEGSCQPRRDLSAGNETC